MKLFEKISTGGKFESAYGVGANLMGKTARLVSSVKCRRPLMVLVTNSDRTKSSTMAFRLLGALVG